MIARTRGVPDVPKLFIFVSSFSFSFLCVRIQHEPTAPVRARRAMAGLQTEPSSCRGKGEIPFPFCFCFSHGHRSEIDWKASLWVVCSGAVHCPERCVWNIGNGHVMGRRNPGILAGQTVAPGFVSSDSSVK